MKRILTLALICLASAGFAAAQLTTITADVLGAHLNYGRGCAACHAPHSGVYGNGNAKTADPTSGDTALWGEDVNSLYGKTILTGGGGFAETLPTSMAATTPDVAGLLTCLSCHDGNYATGAMMKKVVYETLPSTYGTLNSIPTLLGNDGTTIGNYLNDHPVGLAASIGCNPAATPLVGYDWDCTISATGKVQMTGAKSKQFVTNYGFFVAPASYTVAGGTPQPVVVCTTCHNQHLMNVVNVNSSNSGLPPGTYATMFFIRAPYNPADQVYGSNQTAQFCRQCHGYDSNEMNGSSAGTTF